eukprot:scaffold9371_cov211-Amphora_coffeaeformis.AAC.14
MELMDCLAVGVGWQVNTDDDDVDDDAVVMGAVWVKFVGSSYGSRYTSDLNRQTTTTTTSNCLRLVSSVFFHQVKKIRGEGYC